MMLSQGVRANSWRHYFNSIFRSGLRFQCAYHDLTGQGIPGVVLDRAML